jgi:hypothetical protein
MKPFDVCSIPPGYARAAWLCATLGLLAFVAVGCGPRASSRGQAPIAAVSPDDTASRPAPVPRGDARSLPGGVAVVDLSSRFLAFYDSATTGRLDPQARWTLWKRLYGFAAVPPTPFGDSLARRLLDGAWTRYPAVLSKIREGAAGLGVSPESELRRVVELLGCGRQTTVRLIVFVGGFDENAFAFTSRDGIPTVAIPLEAGDAARSIVHELAHAVHRSSGCADIRSGYEQTLAELVISEGLAMRATERLLAGRPATYYIIGAQDWLDSARARRAAILRGIREHLTESQTATVQRFTFGGGTTGLAREAYYAAWEVTGALLRSGMSLQEIATTPGDRVPNLVLRGIDLVVSERAP